MYGWMQVTGVVNEAVVTVNHDAPPLLPPSSTATA